MSRTHGIISMVIGIDVGILAETATNIKMCGFTSLVLVFIGAFLFLVGEKKKQGG